MVTNPHNKQGMMAFRFFALMIFSFGGMFVAFAQSWTQTSAPKNNWYSIASSADGSKLVAVISYAKAIYTSTNFGATWVSNNVPAVQWWSVASSADGARLIAAAAYGGSGIFTSTNSGSTWVSNNIPAYAWFSVASSADGMKLVAVAGGGQVVGPIYTSTDSGVTWVSNNVPAGHWISVASSSDGSKLAALTPSSYYTSTNSGNNWSSNGIPLVTWVAAACSADGSTLLASAINSGIHHMMTSTDFGVTWVTNNASIGRTTAVAASASGTTLAEVELNWIWLSTNSGATWLSNSVTGSWHGVTTSADGTKLAVVDVAPGGIWTWQTSSSPTLRLFPANGVQCSWLVPSANFVLQQSSDLVSWTAVTNPPVLNLTNLENQVALPVTEDGAFFRLATP
jgi:hypothetical protein